MKYETVIGLEIHAQLLTKTKLFCRCSTQFGLQPNSQTCPVCLGLPGSLPVINREAVRMAIKLALALQAQINLKSIFSRKNYFYPDLPKGYQITQYKLPVAEGGELLIESEGQGKVIHLERLHLEEDAGKSLHEGFPDSAEKTYLDFNRCGVPLIEIVTRPEMNTAGEAVEFVQNLRTLLQYLEICDGNMEEGSLRCDANLSIRPEGSDQPGVKTEVKNINSFRFLARALDYEAKRQRELLERGERIIKETRGWDTASGRTISQRSKEEAHDYRYFPEPDLPPLVVSDGWIKEIAAGLPELPQTKIERFIRDYGLAADEARILVSSRALADYYEALARDSGTPRQAANWIKREVLQFLKENNLEINDFPLQPASLAELIKLVEAREITMTIAKEQVFPEMLNTGKEARTIIEEKGLKPIAEDNTLLLIINQVIEENPQPVQQYLGGKTQVLGYLLGQVMKATKGQASPEKARSLLQAALDRLAKS
ncbi:MAG TPA: Asp-tRNA(Asn)/Glu-tRNA(Gln) amidotransferase subunit GatB [Candidatus Saccharicenans sp.]|mgnify:FL=1|nr:Asp-tRNA(Asn)/Glu-tRNA(Gln) amidotransferase subunit GatB [Candidatus Saccharicenans sp.]HQO75988.1 Asp-tRNA(Asn)/Glu-tRNA(Gln) amidotransferase subunit GatB [Candidatus Saccharicenans sp.]HUM78873.1 Asp-tRNA(Asn)/Glu-tRNA(Gln) amidotransferase subunit GatB [Candidatus Saccharicenans sp.]